MDDHFKTLDFHHLNIPPTLCSPTHLPADPVTLNTPAIVVLTDLFQVKPVVIEPSATLGHAQEKMILCEVRLLFVTDTDHRVIGLITAADILGEKPLRYAKERGITRHDLQVNDIMSPVDQLETVHYRQIETATVGDIVRTIKFLGRQHLLVVDDLDGTAVAAIRGLFSATQLSRQLGQEIRFTHGVHSLVERHRALNGL